MILTLPVPIIIFTIFWHLCGAELVSLPPARRPRINILISRYLILVMFLISCVALFYFVADTVVL